MAKIPASPGTTAPLVLVCGDDDFTVKQRARALFDRWSAELGGMDHEIVDATAGNTGEALKKLAKLREALQTLPFFGGAKAVWFRDCNFLGEDRTASSAAVTAALTEFAEELKTFRWDGVRLLISSGKPDKRRSFYKTVEKLGGVETFVALSAEDKDWAGRAESEALRNLRAAGKDISDDALGELVTRVGPNLRALASEVEKLTLYVGDRAEITLADVQTLTTRQKLAQAFALGEALGDRDLGKLMRVLDQELWEIRTGTDKRKSEIGLLYGLISKVRALLMLKELRRQGVLKPARDYNAFKSQLDRVPADSLPPDKRFNPLAGHPFVLFQAMRQTDNYELTELIGAMDTLLDANVKLVSSGLDDAMVLQQALVDIVGLRPRKSATR
jgi:DNA polymerase III subunit delta